VEYRNLGRTGLKVSELCLGTMQFGWTADEATSLEVLTAAFEAGVNFLDSADVYSRWAEGNPGGVAEAIIGKWLKQEPGRRERTVIATKVRGRMGEGPNDEGLSRRHILDAAHASLRRLGIDAIDLYQVHWPDEGTPIDETLTALDDLVRWGDVRYIGCSNFPAWRLVEALGTSDRLGLARFVCLQPHYNLVHRDEYERELEAACLAYGLGVIPYAPLAAGYLTGKYRRGVPLPVGSRGAGSRRIQALLEGERGERVLRVLEKLGGQRGLSISQMALAWLLTRPSVTSPIIGPRSIGQLRDNLGAAGLRLEPRENHELDEVSNWRSEAED
jgi:aryl-alcohol dehydrogenase-like predicted oxidoreductase